MGLWPCSTMWTMCCRRGLWLPAMPPAPPLTGPSLSRYGGRWWAGRKGAVKGIPCCSAGKARRLSASWRPGVICRWGQWSEHGNNVVMAFSNTVKSKSRIRTNSKIETNDILINRCQGFIVLHFLLKLKPILTTKVKMANFFSVGHYILYFMLIFFGVVAVFISPAFLTETHLHTWCIL